ncbi:DNA internalization-related competence protein ComEC/Rec2 [Brevibacillus fulvus]|uniref:Competence protein ComEC n=1 Tax=Brevibacillus fulvus TaxID=1125967 RepID=A0A938Y2A8_9BACL|nr:DNA internalization-related competence protein ComEC/Rec2 [Brevibacillus fulvus]MBM7589900.1 competence protein ComEC [Brevibacillus fulvus]
MGKRLKERLFGLSIAAVVGLLIAAYAKPFLIAAGAAVTLGCCLPLSNRKKRTVLVYLFTAICFAAYFYVYDHLHQSTLVEYVAKDGVELSGIIDSAVERDGDQVRFYAKVDLCKVRANVIPVRPRERIAFRVKLNEQAQIEQAARWRQGHRLTAVVSLSLPAKASNPYAFDYADYLRWQGVTVTAQTQFEQVTIDLASANLFTFFENWQAQAARQLSLVFTDETIAGYMQSLLLGMQSNVSPELEETYANQGLIHVLAISGLHVTLVSGLFLWVVEKVGISREKTTGLTLLFIVVYVLSVGASSSAVRAGIMGMLGIWGRNSGKRLDVLQIWAAALLLMLAINPYQLWQIGFQLSFVVTLGLLIYVPILSQSPYPRKAWLRTAFAVTWSAQLISFPFLIYWFHQFSPLSWLLNLLLVPILSFIVLPAGYVLLVTGWLHPALAYFPSKLISWILQTLHPLLLEIDRLRIPFSYWPHPQPIWLCSYAIFLVLLPVLWHRGFRRRRDAAFYGMSLVLLLVFARQPFDNGNEVRVTFLDVGQGDSIVVEVGKKKVYLIDSGGTIPFSREKWREKREPFEVGKNVVLPYLKARGIERIDHLVLTHGDYDHIGGFFAIINKVSVGSVLVNGTEPSDQERKLLDLLQQHGVSIQTGEPAEMWTDREDVYWTWLHPGPDTQTGENDASLVLLLSAYGKQILFTGDLEQTGEEQLLKSGLLPRVDVLKVGHHGSKTSTSLPMLKKTQPDLAIISVGKNNRYGHPSNEVIQRLTDAGTLILRTDRQGAVTLHIRPDSLTWESQLPLAQSQENYNYDSSQ